MTTTTRNRAKRFRELFRAGAAALCAAMLLSATAARAVDLALPGNARETAASVRAPDSHALATGPFADGVLPLATAEGSVSRAAWRVDIRGITTLQLLAPLRAQLEEQGFTALYECDASSCGGFDFRYRIEVLPEPAMRVDLFDYRYLSARRGTGDAAEHVSVLVSRGANAGFVQIITVAPEGGERPSATASGAPLSGSAATLPRPGDDLPLAAQLETHGHAVLPDLAFETGSSDLGKGNFASLAALAEFLRADPARRVALVGHTDAVGALDSNIALSKRRAASVLERLVSAHGIARAQLAAEGMGYLSPITTNLTAEGREKNRRVEAVLLNTE